jgi:hypothetical protein
MLGLSLPLFYPLSQAYISYIHTLGAKGVGRSLKFGYAFRMNDFLTSQVV